MRPLDYRLIADLAMGLEERRLHNTILSKTKPPTMIRVLQRYRRTDRQSR